MQRIAKALRTGLVGLPMVLSTQMASALDARTVTSIVQQVGSAIYGPLLAPKVVFDNILCSECDISTEHVVGWTMMPSNYNNYLFLRIDKLLAPRVFTKGDLLELCDKQNCAVFMYNPLTLGRPWILVKPCYPDTHTKYRNVSFKNHDNETAWWVTYTTTYTPPLITYEGSGSVKFPPEIWCPGPYCNMSAERAIIDRLDWSDTLMTDFPMSTPTTTDSGWADVNHNNY